MDNREACIMETTQSLSAASSPSAVLSPEKSVLAWYDAWADDMLRFAFCVSAVSRRLKQPSRMRLCGC